MILMADSDFDPGTHVSDIIPQSSALLRELAEQMDGSGVTVEIRVAPAKLVERLEFFEQLRQARSQVRQSNLPPMKRLLFYEQTFQAEDAGSFFPEYTAADIARATGMSPRTVSRHHQELVDAELIRINHYGQGSRKRVEILLPERTVSELSQLIDRSEL